MAQDEDAQPYVLSWSMEIQHVPLRRFALPIFASIGCVNCRHIGVRRRTRSCCLGSMADAKYVLCHTHTCLLALFLFFLRLSEEVTKIYSSHCD